MLYSDYEKKVTKIAKKFAFVKRNRIPIISTLVVVFSFLFTFLGVSGIIQSDLVISKEEFVYGEPLTYDRAKAFASTPHYEYASDVNNPDWTSVKPTLAGDYLVRAYTYNGYHIKRYGKTQKFRILPKSIKLTISNSTIVYGESPYTNANNELVGTDKINNIDVKYDNIFAPSTNATIDLNSIRIVNNDGVDVTGSYSIETEAKNVNISKRPITLSSKSVVREYDGNLITDNKVSVSYGSLANGDYFPVEPTASGSTTFLNVRNSIVPAKEQLKIYNANNVDVTSLYDITYNEGDLSATKRRITVIGPDASKEYNGSLQRASTSSFNANSIKVEGSLASGDYITNASFNCENIYTGDTTIYYNFDIRNSNGESVYSRYNVNQEYGKFTISKKDLNVTFNVNNTGDSQIIPSTENNGKTDVYTKEYDGYGLSWAVNTTNPGLCPGDTLLGSSEYFSDSGTYTPNVSFTVFKNYGSWLNRIDVTNGYNFIYNNQKIVINKRNLKIHVDDLELYSSSSSLSSDLVSYDIYSGNLASGDRIAFTPKNNLPISEIGEGRYNLLDYFNFTLTNKKNYNDTIITNSPKLIIKRNKINAVFNSQSSVYTGSSKTVTRNYLNHEITIKNDSTIPNSNFNITVFNISSTLTDVSKHIFDTSDISFSASYKIKDTTLSIQKRDVDFYLFDSADNSPYFEITKKIVNVVFKPPVKYYDGKNFNPNLLLDDNRFYERTGDLAYGHRFIFEEVKDIKDVGVYYSDDLVNAYKLKIVDGYGNDKTSNYGLTYSFTDLEIKRAQIDLTLNMSSRITASYTYGDLFYKTYSDETVSTFNSDSNDLNANRYNEEGYYTKSSNIEANYDYDLDVNFGIAPNKNVGTYDVRVDDLTLEIHDIYSTIIIDKSLVDIQITNGSNAYEIKKKTVNFQIPDVTYIRDGLNFDYGYELDTSDISLISGHRVEIIGNAISETGTYSASNLNLDFKVLTESGEDVTNNYQLNWTNKSTFKIEIEDARVVISREQYFQREGYVRVYDGTPFDETNFYSSISSPNAVNDSKHSYKFTMELNENLPDSYYDVGAYQQTSSDIPSKYSTVYCTKTLSNGNSQKFKVQFVEYRLPTSPVFYVITTKKDLEIEFSDTAYWLGESEYSFDFEKNPNAFSTEGLNTESGDYIKSIRIKENNGIVFDSTREIMQFDVSDYESQFEIEIFNRKRNVDVTNNYDISFTGTITYKKPSLELHPETKTDAYTGEDKNVGSCIADINLPVGATYSISYDFTLNDGTTISNQTSCEVKDVGIYSYSISSVTVNYEGRDITSYCNLSYSSDEVGRYEITKASVIFNTGNFELGLGFIWDLAVPKIAATSMGLDDFENRFIVQFGNLHDDESGLFTVDENGYVRVVREGETLNQIRDVVIFDAYGNDVTNNFDISWIIGTIKVVDIEINS